MHETATASPRADVILVFGAQAFAHGPSAELRARLAHALALWQEGAAPAIAVSGGRDGDIDEVAVMRGWLEEHGVPPAAVREVLPGDTTRATIVAAADAGPMRVIAVSSPFHSRRIRGEARRRGVHLVTDCPAHTPEADSRAAQAVRSATELLACAWYSLPRSLTARVPTGPGSLRHTIPTALISLLSRR